MSKVVRMFPAGERAKIITRRASDPTGVVFEWGGFSFALMPIEFRQFLNVTRIVDEGQDIIRGLLNAQGKSTESVTDLAVGALGYIASEIPALIFTLRDYLAGSPGVCNTGSAKENEADRKLFDEWFEQQDAVGMLKAFFPKVKEVIGGRPLAIPTPADNEAEPT